MSASGSPGGLPFLSPPNKPPGRSSHRRRRRYAIAVRATHDTNLAIYALNQLHSSSASLSAPRNFNPLSTAMHTVQLYCGPLYRASAVQRSILHVYSVVKSHIVRTGSSFNISAASLDTIITDPSYMQALYSFATDRSLHVSYHNTSTTRPVVLDADRLSLPSSAVPPVSLREFLPREHISRYESATALLLPDWRTRLQSAPRVRQFNQFVDRHQYARTISRLLSIGMVAPLPPGVRPHIVNAIFAVPKSDGLQRLILDDRRYNYCTVDPPHTDLPTPDSFTHVHVPAHLDVGTSWLDLSDFYHRLLLLGDVPLLHGLTALSVRELGPEWAHLGEPEQVLFFVYLRVPMGAKHSVHMAQTGHLHTLQSSGILDQYERISSDSSMSFGQGRYTVCIDDLGLLLPRADHEIVLPRLREFYASRGLPVKLSKQVVNADTAVGLGVSWQNTTSGFFLYPHPVKFPLLVKATLGLVAYSLPVSVGLVQAIVGHWIWYLLLRRPLLAVLSATFAFIHRYEHRVMPLWQSVRAELLFLCYLSPFVFTDLSRAVSPIALNFDASSSALGVITHRVPPSALRTFYDTPARSIAVMASDATLSPHQATITAMLESTQLTEVAARFSAPVRDFDINTKEALAAQTSLTHALQRPATLPIRHHRVLLIGDNTSVLFALRKGRSPSRALLSVCRRIASLVLANDIILLPYYIDTDRNPADVPSRSYDDP